MRRRISLVLVAVALAVIPLACGGSENKAQQADTSTVEQDTATTRPGADPWLTEVATAAVPVVEVLKERPPETSATTGASASGVVYQAASERPAIPRDGYLSAGVSTTPAGYAFDNPTYFKDPLVFVVAADDGGDWLQVELLARPNHQVGWIKRSEVTLSKHRYHLKLTKSTFTLQAFEGDNLLGETQVVIGKDATFTPVGTFFVTEKIARPPSGVYGPWILATSGYSESLDDFDGGLPQMALHGTNNPALIGTKASNGCIRMPNDFVSKLAYTMPAGTPLVITD